MSALMVAPQSPYHLSWFYQSDMVWCGGCLGPSWWKHDAADLRHCCHDWLGERSTVSQAEDPWLASALASHPPPHSAHYHRGSVCEWVDVLCEVSVVDVHWIILCIIVIHMEKVYLSRQCSQWKAELGCRCLGFPRSATLMSSWQLSRENFLQTLLKERGSRWFRHKTSSFIYLLYWSHTGAYLIMSPSKPGWNHYYTELNTVLLPSYQHQLLN